MIDKMLVAKMELKAMKDVRFQSLTVAQIEKVALVMAEQFEKGYAEGHRDGVIEYRKAVARVRDDERGN